MTACISINEKLNQWLGPEWICTRPGPNGTKLHYIEGKSAINIANDLFGYDGWSSEIKDSVVDYLDVGEDGRVSLGIATTVRITLKNSDTIHEDIGYGTADNVKGKAAAFEKARKESATDGLKRALRMLGNAMGNCLYDKTYLRNITNMARSQMPFVPKDLYRQEHIRKSMQTETAPTSSDSSKKDNHATLAQQPTDPPPARTRFPPSLLKQPTHRQPQVLPAARDEITLDILTIKNEPPSSMECRQPVVSQDSFTIDPEDEAFYAQLGDVEISAMEQLQLQQSNKNPSSSRQSSFGRISPFSIRCSPSSSPRSPSIRRSSSSIHLSSSSSRSSSKSGQSRKRQRP